MCVVLYIASDVPLPLIPWNQEHPAFNVSNLDPDHSAVRKHFSKSQVYYVGSHTSCGCGFECWEEQCGVHFDVDPEKARESRQSRAALAEYLRFALSLQESVQLYACWSGDEGREPERREQIVPEDLIEKHTHFVEPGDFAPEFLTVVTK